MRMAMPRRATTQVTEERIWELLQGEVTYLAGQNTRPAMSLTELLERCSTKDVVELAGLMHEEVAINFAKRIKMLRSLPDWEQRGQIRTVHKMYMQSFKQLRLVEPENLEEFTDVIRLVKDRHSRTNLLVGAFKSYAEEQQIGEADINKWMDAYFHSRIATNMLAAHFLYLRKGEGGKREDCPIPDMDINPYLGGVVSEVSAEKTAQAATQVVAQLCQLQYGVAPQMVVECEQLNHKKFPFVPRYLFYIITELLKNSCRATVEKWHGTGSPLPPIVVTLGGHERICSVRVTDRGGGVPGTHREKVWSYLYTTAAPVSRTVTRAGVDAPADYSRLQEDPSAIAATSSTVIASRSPLAGLGCGLPLSRLYARFLGGEIRHTTTPGYGMDVYVYLPRLGDKVALPASMNTLKTEPMFTSRAKS